uniref:Ovule protein n=1 Tax=Parascaris univalens TaxID=6257 RepID=A0A915C1E9_PARUN
MTLWYHVFALHLLHDLLYTCISHAYLFSCLFSNSSSVITKTGAEKSGECKLHHITSPPHLTYINLAISQLGYISRLDLQTFKGDEEEVAYLAIILYSLLFHS